MEHKPQTRQFKGTKAPRLFFDRRVRPTGNTRSISIGKLLPERWSYVRLEVIDREANSVTIKVTKLLEIEKDASDTTANPRSKQNT